MRGQEVPGKGDGRVLDAVEPRMIGGTVEHHVKPVGRTELAGSDVLGPGEFDGPHPGASLHLDVSGGFGALGDEVEAQVVGFYGPEVFGTMCVFMVHADLHGYPFDLRIAESAPVPCNLGPGIDRTGRRGRRQEQCLCEDGDRPAVHLPRASSVRDPPVTAFEHCAPNELRPAMAALGTGSSFLQLLVEIKQFGVVASQQGSERSGQELLLNVGSACTALSDLAQSSLVDIASCPRDELGFRTGRR